MRMAAPFSFKVTVKDPAAAMEQIRAGFEENGVVALNGRFSGSGFEGRYSIAGNVVNITITDKPVFVMNWQIVNQVKEYLDGV